MSSILTVDAGTSSVKALLVDSDGRGLGEASAPVVTAYPARSRAEQKPDDWWEAARGAIRSAIEQAPRGQSGEIVALGVTGQQNGLVFLDAGGQVVRDSPIWLDQRAEAEAGELTRRAGTHFARTSLNYPTAVHVVSKLLWHSRHEPEVMARTARVLFPKDYLVRRMTGRHITDVTNAGAGLLLDLSRRAWSEETLELIGLGAGKLPALVEPSAIVGTVLPDVARDLGLPAELPVTAGSGDMAAVAVGTGMVRPATACATLGTAGHVAVYAAELPVEPDPRLRLLPHAVPGAWYWHGLVMSAGDSLRWARRLLAGTRAGAGQAAHAHEEPSPEAELTHLLEAAKTVPSGSRGLLFLPYLQGAATPHMDGRARGVLAGLDSTHGGAEVFRAVLEGVAYNIRDCFEAIEEHDVAAGEVVTGEGGSRSELWLQIIADVLGRDVVRTEERSTSCLGAAVIAAVGIGLYSGFAEACANMVRYGGSRITPRREARETYASLYESYRRVYPQMRDILHTLSRE